MAFGLQEEDWHTVEDIAVQELEVVHSAQEYCFGFVLPERRGCFVDCRPCQITPGTN